MLTRVSLSLAFVLAASAAPAETALDDLPMQDRIAVFAAAEDAGEVGTARKTKPVDARPARAGEVIVTIIKGDGTETRSKPAQEGDWVVRNRCPETGNEEYLVAAAKFAPRYGQPRSAPAADGFMEFVPLGAQVHFTIVPDSAGEYAIEAPWGEKMRVQPGDALVQSFQDATDIYRVEARSFACTYEVTAAP
jgi:hypothetical protein